MKKITLLVASCALFVAAFGQNITQKNVIQTSTVNQVAKTLSQPISDEDRLAQMPKTPSGHIRCISPTTHQSEEQFESWITQKIAEISLSNNYAAKASRNIPVVVHVLHNGDAVGSGENISVAQIQSQIDALNEDFSATNGDIGSVPGMFTGDVADSDIQFCLALTDPTGSATNGINRINIGVASVSDTDIETNYGLNNMWDPTKYLNIFVGNLTGGLLGKAVFPTGSGLPGMPGGGPPAYDGVMCGATAFGRTGSASAPYNLGRTATHEIGHWLGLRHIGGDASGGCGDDYCADTPAQKGGTGAQGNGFGQNYGCPTHPLTYAGECSGTTAEMFMNYMDYTNDACMYMFTNDQKLRMDAVLSNSPQRVELLTSNRCQPPAISADFTADITTVNVGGSVNFTDQSVSPNTINYWSWTFPGGTPNSFIGQTPPAITYSTPGQYNATLTIADNGGGNDSIAKINYINVVVAGVCDTLNHPPAGTVVTYTTASGYMSGWNEYSDISKAELIASPHNPYTYITGGLFGIRSANDGGNGATVDFNVWDATGPAGAPGTILASVTVPLSSLDFNAGYENTLVEIMFNEAVNVGTGDFYFGYSMNGFQATDTLGMFSNTDGDSSPGTAWEQWSDLTWYEFNSASAWGVNVTQYIAPYLSQDAPTAVINTDATTICQGGTVNFDATSSSNSNSYNWVFNSGSPTSSTNSTEPVTYSAAGTPRAYLIANGNCGAVAVDSVDITVDPTNTASAASSSPSVCINTAMTNVTHTTTGATGIGSATGLPAGVTANWSGNTITISGTPTSNGTFNYTIPLTGGCGTVNATGTITVITVNTASAASSSPTVCVNTAMTNVTHTTTGATGIGSATGLPAGVTANWSGNMITISGTPTVDGAFNYTIPLTGGCGSVNATGTITVDPANTASAASSSPTLCVNTTMTNVTHTTTGATGIGSATGLPAGVTANWSGNTITISGTPTADGTFNYTIPLTGGCGSVDATGTITVDPANTASAASSSPSVCINTAMTNVTHTTTGATGIGSATGLPAGVTANWSGNTITISGTPTADGTFNYTIPLTGGCGSADATGTITVTTSNSVSAASSSPTVCVNTAMTNVTHTTTGATGIGSATGLPAGVTANWSGNMITISGTPTADGTFNYTIPTTGGCGSADATGTITVNAANTVSVASSSPSVCINTAIANVTHTTTGATGIGTATGLPAGVTANWSGGTITISGTPTVNGTFNYTIPLTGGCGTVNGTGTITVTSGNTVSVASSSPSVCINTAMTNVTHTTTGATGIGTATGLPAGVTANWSGGTITISGTPTANGMFNYTIPTTGGCGSVNATGTITVNPQDNATISYPQATYCITDGDATPTITGDAGGFISSPVGLSIDGVSGVIGVSASAAGNYTVTYTTTGACPVAVNTSVEIDMCTGIAENVNSTVKIFPNPASSMLTIESVNQDINQIRLVNILGETVISKNTQSTRTVVNVEQLSMGVYFIQLFDQSGKIVMTRKVSIK